MSTSPKFCAHCGAPLTPNSRFCEHCGQPVAPTQSASPQVPMMMPTATPVVMMPAQAPPRKSRAGCVIGVLLAGLVLCCIAPVAGGFIFFRFSDAGRAIVPTLEAMATEMAGLSTPDSPPAARATSLADALSGNDQATDTPRPVADGESSLPIGSATRAVADAVAQDFVGDWEVIAAQEGDGTQRDDLIGEQIRLMLSDDGETILGVELPYDGPTEPGLWLKAVGERSAAGEVIDTDPTVTVTATLSEDGQQLEMTMGTSTQEVSLTFQRIGAGDGQ